MIDFFKEKVILCTGGSGSWGNELATQLLEKNPKKIIIFSRGELAQVNMQRKFNNNTLEFIIGDVRDYDSVNKSCKDVDYVFHCFPSGTKIICDNTIKNIENVMVGDKVFSSDGKLNIVNNLIRRKIDDDLINIKSYFNNIPLISTCEHPYLVWRPSKKCPYAFRTNCTPSCNNKNKGNCPEHYKKDNVNWVNAGDIVKGDYISIPILKINNFDTPYNKDMMRLFGYYLSEGNINKKGYSIRFTFNSKEEDYICDVENVFFKNFNKKGKRYYNKFNSCTITVCGKDIVNVFREFGIGAHNKTIPSWVFGLYDKIKIEQLLLGYYRGDGCFSTGRISTVSENLAYQIRLLFGMIGIATGFSKFNRKLKKNVTINGYKISAQKTSYQISISKLNNNNINFFKNDSKNHYKCFITDSHIFYLVKKVNKERKNTMVYNLSVSGNNTYNVHGYSVHNCAALKHVPICEKHPQEAIKTNINGTINLINACINNGVKKFIDVSTDKACQPFNLYGMTKSVGERLSIQANNLTKYTEFVCVRGGNVLGTNGSVVPHFIDSIKTHNKIDITSVDMTRFFLTLSDAISLLFCAAENSIGGETYVMNMPSFYIRDLAEILIEHYGNNDTKMKEIGIREGEKLNEILISEHEALNSYVYNKDYYVILPSLKINKDYSHIDPGKKVTFKEFSSADNLKDKVYLRELLINGGFLK